MPRTWINNLKTILIRDEGIAYSPYKDSKGFWTIGIGNFIGKDLSSLRLSWGVIQVMCEENIESALDTLDNIFGDSFDKFSEPRQLALVSMVYNLGGKGFSGFIRMIEAIKRGDWATAADECLDSKWAKDVDPKGLQDEGRDDRIAYMIRTGEFHPDYQIKTSC